MNDHSQYGETKLIAETIATIERNGFSVPRVACEFGSGDGVHLSNIRGLMEEGWTGYQYDQEHGQRITAENVNSVVPESCGVLSIDVDGCDFWIWQALERQPCIVVIEFNQTLSGRKTIPYDPDHCWAGDDYFGASFQALLDLGRSKGYRAIAKTHCNLILALAKLWPAQEPALTHEPILSAWPVSGRAFQEV